MSKQFFLAKQLRKPFRSGGQNGAALLYLVAAILIAGTLGAVIVSLTTTSTLGELGYNSSDQARHLAQSGLDYAASALEAEELKTQFREGNIDDTVFNLDEGESRLFRLTVSQDEDLPTLYHITSEGRAQVGTGNEAGFLVKGETWVNIYFSDHNIDVTTTWPFQGYIELEDTPDPPGYTYDGYDNNNLVLYDYQEIQLVTITANETLRYSNYWNESLGTTHELDEGGLLEEGDHLEFTFPEDHEYTELTIHFTSFDEGDEARISEGLTGNPTIERDDITDSSATVTSNQPFNEFTIESRRGEFGISGIKVKAE